MEPKIGLQMWSVRDGFGKDPAGMLERIAEIGYTDLQVNYSFSETSGDLTFGKDLRAADLKKLLDRFGLRAVSAHYMSIPGTRLEAIVDDLHLLGVDTLACAIYFWETRDEVLAFNKNFNEQGEFFKKNGIQLYYHNHFHEFQVFGDKAIFEMILEGTDKDLIKIEFDTFWAARGGQDPIYWLKKLGKRCDLIHQKDLPANASPVNFFEKFGYDSHITIDAMWQTQDAEHFTEVGEGVMNITGIVEASRKYNQAQYIFIEQDMTKKTELESIAVSFVNMKKLLEQA